MTDKQTVKFGDICREVKLTTKDPIADGYEHYIGLEHLDSGSLKIKRWGMIAEDNPSFTRVFKKGHILLGKRRPYLKKAAIAEFDGICSSDIIVIEANERKLLKELLLALIHSELFWSWASLTSSGSLSPRTKYKHLSEFSSIKIPANEKQVEMKFAFEKWQKYSEELTGLIIGLNLLKKRVISSIVVASNGWSSVGDYVKVTNGITPSKSIDEYWSGNIPWVSSGKVNDRFINEPTDFISEKALKETSCKLYPKNTVLIAMIGQGKTRGMAAKLEIEAAINQNLAAIPPCAGLNPTFLFDYFESRYSQIRSMGRGSNQEALNCKLVSEIEIPNVDISRQNEYEKFSKNLEISLSTFEDKAVIIESIIKSYLHSQVLGY